MSHSEITDNGRCWPFRRYGWVYVAEDSYVLTPLQAHAATIEKLHY